MIVDMDEKFRLIITEGRELRIELGPEFADGDVDALVAAATAARETVDSLA